MGHLQGIEDCSEVRIFRPCIPRINIKNIKPPFFRKHLNVSDDEQLTCSWTQRYRFLLVRVCQWWMLDQSPSKTQRSRVQSDRVGLYSTSYEPWSITDIIEGILTENVRAVLLNTDHQHKSYICVLQEIPATVVVPLFLFFPSFLTPGQSTRAVFLCLSWGAAATPAQARSGI